MKTRFLSLIFLFAVTAVFGQQAPKPESSNQALIKAVIVSFQKSDNNQKKPALLKVKTDQGEELTLTILSTSVLLGADGKSLSGDKLLKGLKVSLKIQADGAQSELVELSVTK